MKSRQRRPAPKNHSASAAQFASLELELEDLQEEIPIEIEEGDYETLNGLLVSILDHIPTPDEKAKIHYNGYVFKVLSVSDNMIQVVEIRKEEA